MRRWLLLIVLLATIIGAFAQTRQQQQPQQPEKKKSIMVDTLDHKLDFSRYLIDMHGFIPWPSLISEPALGNFGLAMALVFISQKERIWGIKNRL